MPRYRVLLPYTEPSFSVRLGRSEDYLYPGEMTMEADDEAEAIERAIQCFPSGAGGGVGWIRLPQRIGIQVQKIPVLSLVR